MKIKMLVVLFTLLLGSCAKNYQFSSNLDPENFKTYFSTQKVKIYPSIEALPKDKELVGLVEGNSCQLKAHHEAPNEVDARTIARQQAAKLQANAIVFSQCVEVAPEQCHKQIVCYGQAYKVITE